MTNSIIKFEENNKELVLFMYNEKAATISTELMEFEGYAEPRKAWYKIKNREDFEESFEYITLQGEELRKFKEEYGDIIVDVVTNLGTSSVTLFEKYKKSNTLDIVMEDGIFGVMYASNSGHANKFKKFMRREVNPHLNKVGNFDPKEIEIMKIEDDKERSISLRLYNIEKALLVDSSDMLTQLNYNNTRQELEAYKQSKRIDNVEDKVSLIESKVNRSVVVREGDCTAEAVARKFGIFSAASNKPHGSFAEHLSKELGIYISPDGNIGYQDKFVTVNIVQRGGVEVPTLKYSKEALKLMEKHVENEGIRFEEVEHVQRGKNKDNFRRAKIAFDTGNIWVNETTYNLHKE
ncbi:hypothetical protein [Metabacillus fastidiosus]|uniref:hypothetical protein n=1 Tax=Metabacillus fastidiosus TaxID=1458 RepID=UPI003D2E46B7